MQTLTDIRIYTGAMRREGDDLHATDVKLISDEWIYVYADDDSINIVRVPAGAVCECEPQPIPEPTPRCDNSGTNVLATLLRGADGKGVSGGYFEDDGTLVLVMEDGSKVSVGRINLSNYYTKKEVDGKKLPNPWGLNYSFNGTSGTYDGSMSKYLPSIYAPSSAGKKGQILSSNGVGEPVWVDTTSLSGAEVKWEDVQNKPTTIKGFGINDAYTKSEVDGKLEEKVSRDEAIEFAKDLTGVLEATPEEFVFRASAGTKSIRDESAVIRRIKGNTSVWAQYADNPIFANGTSKWNRVNTTLSIDTDGSLKVKHDTDSSQGFSQIFDDGHIPSGHRVLVVVDYKRSTSTAKSLLVYLRKESQTGFDRGALWVSSASRRTDGIIITTTEPSVSINIYPFIGGAVEDYTNVYSVNIFDLTAIFGAGNEPTTLEEFKKTYPESYYPYCAPEVRSMRATGIETIGANAFNKDSVVGGLINADGTVTSNDIYSVAKIEVVPNEVYTLSNVANAANTTYTYALYDSEDRFISVGEIKNSVTKPISVSGDVTIPMNARYIRVVVHNDCLNSCCINLKHSGTLTAEEAGYFKEVRMLPDIATYFPDGMHGIGGVYDEINEESAIKRFGVVDLGTLEWTTYTLNGLQYWWATIGDIKMLGIEYFPNIACSKLSAQTLSNVFTGRFDNSIAPHNSLPRVYARSSAYTDAASFKAAMTGVMLVYELAEPIGMRITKPLQLDYKVADFGTEKMLHNLPSSPFRADIVYQFNAEGRIRDNARNIERLESIVDSVKDDKGYLYSNGEKVDMRFTRSLIPIGTSIPAKADLNTVAYLKVGKYYCSLNADAKTITNCPTANAFMMEVFNPLSTVVDNEVDSTYVYRIRILTEYSTGIQYVQYCTVGSTVNKWTYDSWYVCPRTKFTLNSSKNDGTAAIGSKTQGVYVDSSGTLQKMTYSLNKTVPSNAVFTDTDTKVTEVANHYAPAEDESAALNAPSGTVVTGIKRDAAGHVVGIVTGVGSGGGGTVDLSNYYTKQEIEDKGYLKEIPEEYLKEEELPTTLPNPQALQISVDGKAAVTYNGSEAKEITIDLPNSLADLNDDSTHRTVTDTEKATWDSKSDFSGNYADLNGKPTFKTINGESILGAGDIAISGGSGASGSAQLPLRTITENMGQTWAIQSGMVTVFTTEQTEGANFLLQVGNEEAGVDNVWVVRFSIGAANTGTYQVRANTYIKWANGVAPTFENGKYYELSFRLIGQTFLGVWASFE